MNNHAGLPDGFDDWLAYGRDVERRYERGMLVDGRPITNVEMLALIRMEQAEARTRKATDDNE